MNSTTINFFEYYYFYCLQTQLIERHGISATDTFCLEKLQLQGKLKEDQEFMPQTLKNITRSFVLALKQKASVTFNSSSIDVNFAVSSQKALLMFFHDVWSLNVTNDREHIAVGLLKQSLFFNLPDNLFSVVEGEFDQALQTTQRALSAPSEFKKRVTIRLAPSLPPQHKLPLMRLFKFDLLTI